MADPNIVHLPALGTVAIVAHLRARWEQGLPATPLGDRGLIQLAHSDDAGLKDFTGAVFKQMVREQRDQALFLW